MAVFSDVLSEPECSILPVCPSWLNPAPDPFASSVNLSRQSIRPAVKALRLEWYGWHAYRRGIASNLFELGANEKVVQRILRHANPHVTKERYIKAFDPAVLAAMKTLETTLDDFHNCSASVQQVN
jgi:integrase